MPVKLKFTLPYHPHFLENGQKTDLGWKGGGAISKLANVFNSCQVGKRQGNGGGGDGGGDGGGYGLS